MSTTTGSPGPITRSETSWCGLAPFGPEATIAKSTPACPSARIASATSRPQPLGHPPVHPVDRRAGRPQRLDLVRGLALPQRAEHLAGQLLGRVRHRRAQAEHLGRVHVVVQPDPAGRARQLLGHQPVRVLAVGPVEYLQVEAAERGGQRGRPLQPGHHQHGIAVRRQHQAGDPLGAVPRVAGEVAKVGTGADQQCVEAGRRGGGARPDQAVGEVHGAECARVGPC
jgi:hypothetical protein